MRTRHAFDNVQRRISISCKFSNVECKHRSFFPYDNFISINSNVDVAAVSAMRCQYINTIDRRCHHSFYHRCFSAAMNII